MVPIVPFAARLYGPLAPYAYTLIRIATGAIFVPHGVLKLFFGGASSAMGYGFGVLELLGGLAIALGIYVRPLAVLLIVDVLLHLRQLVRLHVPPVAGDPLGQRRLLLLKLDERAPVLDELLGQRPDVLERLVRLLNGEVTRRHARMIRPS